MEITVEELLHRLETARQGMSVKNSHRTLIGITMEVVAQQALHLRQQSDLIVGYKKAAEETAKVVLTDA